MCGRTAFRALAPGLLAAGLLAAPPFPAAPDGGTRVAIRGFAFHPARVVIRAGDSVVWTNADAAPHTATGTDGAWDTGGLARGASGVIRFTEPGRYAYLCSYHPQMRGEVVVTAE